MHYRPKRIFFAFLAVALAGVLSSVAIVNPFTQGFLHKLANERLAPLALKLHFDRFELSWLPLAVSFYGIALDGEGQGENPRNTVVVGKARLEVSWWSLLIGRPLFSDLQLESTSLHLGDLNFFLQQLDNYFPETPSLPAEASSRSFTRVIRQLPLKNITFKNMLAYIAYKHQSAEKDPATVYEFSFAPSQGRLSKLGEREDLYLSFDFKQIALRQNHRLHFDPANIQATLRVDERQIASSVLRIQSPQLDLRGEVKLLALSKNQQESFFVENSWKGWAEFWPLKDLLGLKKTQGRFEGAFSIDADIGHSEERPVEFFATAKGSLTEGYFDGFHLFDSDFSLSIDRDKVSLDEVKVREQGRQLIAASGTVGLHPPIPLAFAVSKVDMHLGSLLQALDVPFEVVDLAIASDKTSLKGQAENFFLDIAADATINEIQVKDFDRLNQGLSLLTNCAAKVRVKVSKDQTTILPSSLACKGPRAKPEHNQLRVGGDIFHDPGKGVNLTIAAQRLDLSLAESVTPFKPAGFADINAVIAVANGALKTTVSARGGSEVFFNQAHLEDFAAEVLINEDELSWHNAQFRWKNPDASPGELHASQGRLRFADLRCETSASIKNLSQQVLNQALVGLSSVPPVSAAIDSLELDFAGNILFPSTYRWHARTNIRDLIAANEKIADSLRFDFSRSQTGARLEGGEYLQANLAANLSAEVFAGKDSPTHLMPWSAFSTHPWWEVFGFSHRDQLKLLLASSSVPAAATELNRSPTNLGDFPWIGAQLSKAGLAGDLVMNLELSGPVAAPLGTLSGSLEKASFIGAPLMPLHCKGSVDQGRAKLDFEQAGGELLATVGVDISQPKLPYSWAIQFQQFDIRALAPQALYTNPLNYAYLSGQWNMKGMLRDWWHSTGELRISEVQLHYRAAEGLVGNTPLSNNLHLSTMKEARVQISPQAWQMHPDFPLVLGGDAGRISLDLGTSVFPQHLDLQLKAAMDLNQVRDLIPGIETASGTLGLTAEVHGNLDTPQLRAHFFNAHEAVGSKGESIGNASAEVMSLGFVNLKPAFRDIELDIALDQEMVTINQLKASKGAGKISATGKLNLSARGAEAGATEGITLSMQRGKFTYGLPFLGEINTLLSGTMRLSKEQGPLLLSGTVRIDQLSAKQKVDLNDEFLASLIREERVASESRQLGRGQAFKYQLAVSADKTIQIKNNNADVVFSADLNVLGDNNKTNILGSLKAEEGGKIHYKQKFLLKRGDIFFNDPLKINPIFELEAETSVDSRQVTVMITGDSTAPAVELLVNPAQHDENGRMITQQEALIMLSTGSLPKASDETLSGVGTAAVLNVVGQSQWSRFSHIFDQNFVQIYPEIASDETTGLPTPQLVAPIKLIDSLDLVLTQSLKTSKAAFEVPIHDTITLSGSRTARTVESTDPLAAKDNSVIFDLRFKIPFK